MAQIKAVIFDMDGVLIDAREWHYEALNRALSLFGMEISRYDHLTNFDGLPTKRKLEMLSKDRQLPSALHQFINNVKQSYTMEMVYANCRPMFIHQYALARLHREGQRLAVCSNSIRDTVQVMLQKAMISKNFEFFLSNEDVKKPKPDPEIYLQAISKMKLDPKEVLIVEDNENGIRAATASGAHVLQVTGVTEVTYQNIANAIQHAQTGGI